MANDVNTVALGGNLTRDPELRDTNGGAKVLAFGLAVTGSRRTPQGGWEDEPNYFDAVVFGSRAEALAGILRKGSRVFLSGRLKYESWQAQDGSRRSRVVVVAENVGLPSKPATNAAEIIEMCFSGQYTKEEMLARFAPRGAQGAQAPQAPQAAYQVPAQPQVPQAPAYAPAGQYAPPSQAAPYADSDLPF